MRTATAWIIALAFLASAAGARETWPTELAGAEQLVRSALGDISFDQVDVRQRGRTLEITIPLENVPAQFRSSSKRSGEDPENEVFLATNFVQAFRDQEGIAEFSVVPINAHLVDYYFGFWVFNFGKLVKLPAEITIIGENGQEKKIGFRRKKFKVKRRSLTLKFIEGQVSAPGLFALRTAVGPHSLTTYFCNSCSR